MIKYNFALQILETEINILIKNYEYKSKSNPVEHIKSRLKSNKSCIDKLKRKGLEINIDNLKKYINDIIGIRIVCSFVSDVYSIVNVIKNSNQFDIKDEKDYIKKPKDTGYMSYHIIIKVPIYLHSRVEYVSAEIQIRTIAMDFWASIDHKLQYKFPFEIPNHIKKEMLNCSIVIQSLDNKLHKINEDMKKYK